MNLNHFKLGDLLHLIPSDVLDRKLLSGDSEIEPSFLCFEENYLPIANNVPLDYTIVDCGCYMGAQAYYFQDHKKYIGIDPYDMKQAEREYDYIPPERFFCKNTEHYSCTIDDFLQSQEFENLDLDKTYFVCSAVPSFESTEKLFNKVKNCAVFYPGEEDLIKGVSRVSIILERIYGDRKPSFKSNKIAIPSEYTYTHTLNTGTLNQDTVGLDLEKFEEVKNQERGKWGIKPKGGLWLSVNNGWENWCEHEEPEWINGNKRYEITLKEDANILLIDSVQDLENLPRNKDVAFLGMHVGLDFEKLAKTYDGIQVMINDDKTPNISFDNCLYQKLYTWDCNSTVLFNKECIKEIKEIEPIRITEPNNERQPVEVPNPLGDKF